MKVILFDEHECIASKLRNILKTKYNDVETYTNLLNFLVSIHNEDNTKNILFILSSDILKVRNIEIGYILKNFNCYYPIMTYNLNANIYLKLEINYIYEYQRKNYNFFVEDIHSIVNCFSTFANDKEFFSSCNFQYEEVPIYLSTNKNNKTRGNLYKVVDIRKKSDITSCLTKMQSKLFIFLLSNSDGASITEISYNLWGSGDKSKAQGVYTLVHGLNQIISQKTTNEYQIIHKMKKYQLIQASNSSSDLSLNNASITGNLNGCSVLK